MPSDALLQTNSAVTSMDRRIETAKGSLSDLSDETLLRCCAEGQGAALAELARRYQSDLHRFLCRYLGSEDDAEQATLNIFVRAWQSAPRFQYRAKVSTWLYRIAINIARDAHKHRRAQPKQEAWPAHDSLHRLPLGSAEEDALQRLEREDRDRALQRALKRMNEGDRLLLVLYYFEDRTYEEMQAITELSYKVLKSRLTRARQRLRVLMNAEIAEADS